MRCQYDPEKISFCTLFPQWLAIPILIPSELCLDQPYKGFDADPVFLIRSAMVVGWHIRDILIQCCLPNRPQQTRLHAVAAGLNPRSETTTDCSSTLSRAELVSRHLSKRASSLDVHMLRLIGLTRRLNDRGISEGLPSNSNVGGVFDFCG